MSSRRRWLQALLIIAAVLLLPNWQLLVGIAAPHWDAESFFGPQFSLVADHAKAGRILLWDPWVAGGTPDMAEPEMGVTSPLTLLIGLLSPSPQAGFVAYWLIVWFFGGCGMLLLAKRLGSPPWGSLVVALGVATSGFYTGHAEHTSSIYSVSFLPWIVWRLHAALEERRFWPAIQAGVLYGLSALGGYPELVILTGFFLALWAAGFAIFSRRESRAPILRSAVCVVAIALIGAAILSPIYVGFMRSTHGYSDRVGPRSREESLTSNLLPPPAFTTLVSPYLAVLNLAPNPIWPETDVSMTSVYAGSCVLFFALWSLRRRNGWRWYLLGLAVLIGCCCVGNYLPVRGWLYDFVPPTRYFRNPALFRCYLIFVLGVLAAFGTRDLDEAYGRRRMRFFGLAGVIAGYIGTVLFAYVAHESDKRPDQWPWAILQVVIAWTGLAAVTVMVQRGTLTRRRLAESFVAIAVADAALSLFISAPILYGRAEVATWHAMNKLHRPSLRLPDLNRQFEPPPVVATFHSNDNLPLRVSTLNNFVTMTNRFDDYTVNDPALSKLWLGKQRMWFAPQAVQSPLSVPAFNFFVSEAHQHAAPLLLLHTPEEMNFIGARTPAHDNLPGPETRAAEATLCRRVQVADLQYEPNLLQFTYRASEPGWLLVTDRWAQGWRVTVNGQDRPNLAADFIFRAVQVQPGLNTIRYSYHPPTFWPLTIFSWGILSLYLAGECLRAVQRRKTRPVHAGAERQLEAAAL